MQYQEPIWQEYYLCVLCLCQCCRHIWHSIVSKFLCNIFHIEKYFWEMNVRFYLGLSAFSNFLKLFSICQGNLKCHKSRSLYLFVFFFLQDEILPLIFLRCQQTRMKINKRELSQWVDVHTVDASKTHCHQKAISNSRI